VAKLEKQVGLALVEQVESTLAPYQTLHFLAWLRHQMMGSRIENAPKLLVLDQKRREMLLGSGP
jgi:hypothetical protein